eukprot:1569658-Karenia_brevis.AAC.1
MVSATKPLNLCAIPRCVTTQKDQVAEPVSPSLILAPPLPSRTTIKLSFAESLSRGPKVQKDTHTFAYS